MLRRRPCDRRRSRNAPGLHRRHPGHAARRGGAGRAARRRSGLEVLRARFGADPEIAFVVFSNNSGPAYRKRYLGEAPTAFSTRPTNSISSWRRWQRRPPRSLNPADYSWRNSCPLLPPPAPVAIPIASAPATDAAPTALKTQCSSCHLRDLCLPCGMRDRDVDRLDSLMFARRKRRGRADAVSRRRQVPVHLRGAQRHLQVQPDAGRRPRAGQRLPHRR